MCAPPGPFGPVGWPSQDPDHWVDQRSRPWIDSIYCPHTNLDGLDGLPNSASPCSVPLLSQCSKVSLPILPVVIVSGLNLPREDQPPECHLFNLRPSVPTHPPQHTVTYSHTRIFLPSHTYPHPSRLLKRHRARQSTFVFFLVPPPFSFKPPSVRRAGSSLIVTSPFGAYRKQNLTNVLLIDRRMPVTLRRHQGPTGQFQTSAL